MRVILIGRTFAFPEFCRILDQSCDKLINGPQAIGATFAAMIGAGMLVRSISYENSPMPKHLAWALHAGKVPSQFSQKLNVARDDQMF